MSTSAEVISHWHHRAEDFSTSALDFYAAVKRELQAIEAPVRFDNVEWSERGLFSAKRSYLRIEHNRLTFDVCAAPFGRSFFFSWWLAKRAPDRAALYGCLTLIALPIVLLIALATAGFLKGLLIFVGVMAAGWWLLQSQIRAGATGIEDAILAMPYAGIAYQLFVRPVTYYAVDTRIMFEQTVHETVLKVVEALLAAKGAKALTAEERKPSKEPTLV